MSLALLELAANSLGPIVDDVAFVGGATLVLWVDEPGAPDQRPTVDVDVVCDVATRSDYYALRERLAGQGFVEAIDEPVICRWHHRASKLILDVMPTDPEILGFTNAWYASAPASLHRFVSAEAGSLLQHPDVDYAILDATREYGSAQAERGQVVRERLGAIAAIA